MFFGMLLPLSITIISILSFNFLVCTDIVGLYFSSFKFCVFCFSLNAVTCLLLSNLRVCHDDLFFLRFLLHHLLFHFLSLHFFLPLVLSVHLLIPAAFFYSPR